nr:hypothetical protein [Lysobacter enzymogenes]
MRATPLILTALALAPLLAVFGAGSKPAPAGEARAVAAFATVQKVFQHPRCQNCHIPGDQPLQFDDGRPHAQGVVRGPTARAPPACRARPATAKPTCRPATAPARHRARRTGNCRRRSTRWPGSACPRRSCAR